MAAPKPDSVADIGRRLRLIRLAYGAVQKRAEEMSQSEMARLLDLNSASTWNNWETGDNRIGINGAMALAKRTGVSLDYIYFGERAGLPHAMAIEIGKLEQQKTAKKA